MDKPADPGDYIFTHGWSHPGPEQAHPIPYISQLGPNDKSKLVFKAKTSDGQIIVVKFTDRYNIMGHRLLAHHSLAPQVLYISIENTDTVEFGYKVMVMIEFLEGQTAKQSGLLYQNTN